jgi:hypothetical protein
MPELLPPLTGYPTAAPPPTMAGDGQSWAIRPRGAPILSWRMDIRRTGYDEHIGEREICLWVISAMFW